MISEQIPRYLGIKGKEIPEDIKATILEVIKEAELILRPNCLFKETKDISFFGSKALEKHLDGCEKFFLFSATLGVEADRLLTRYSKTDMAKASVAQAVFAAMIEEYADKEMKEREADGLFFRPRFSPGYSDFKISHQKTILSLTNADKLLGITLTDSYMMIPEKSITAVLGLSREKSCILNKCNECNNKNCLYRKEET